MTLYLVFPSAAEQSRSFCRYCESAWRGGWVGVLDGGGATGEGEGDEKETNADVVS